MKEYTNALDSIRDEFQKKCDELGDKIRQEVVIPCCKHNKLKYVSGHGTFFFYNSKKNYGAPDEIDDPVLRATLTPIFYLLNTVVFNNDVLGYYVRDVKNLRLHDEELHKCNECGWKQENPKVPCGGCGRKKFTRII